MAEFDNPLTSGGQAEMEGEDPALIIVYQDDVIKHQALGLVGGPVPQGPTPAASGEDFHKNVYAQLVAGVPDKELHCVEDARATAGSVTGKKR